MRKVIAIEFITLDGVVQAPGGPDEDTSGGFAHGGWIRPYADPVQSAVIRQQMSLPFDLLLGRTTFEIWAPYWPQHPNVWPGVQTATTCAQPRPSSVPTAPGDPNAANAGRVAHRAAITLGRGKRLFEGGAFPAAFRVTEGQVTSTGVILGSYERAGALDTGSS